MIKTLLIEDELSIRKGLTTLLNSLKKDLIIIGECASVKEAITVVKACTPDLVFLDFNLPDGTAFDFLQQTKELNLTVIFVTDYDQCTLKALKLGAINHITKPIDSSELEVAIDKAIHSSDNLRQKIRTVSKPADSERLVLSLQNGYQVINISKLKYCKSDKGYTTFYLEDTKSSIVASKPLKYFIDKLPASNFVRVHQSSLVNLNYVDRYDKCGMVILRDKVQIPVSVRRKEAFLSKLLNENSSHKS